MGVNLIRTKCVHKSNPFREFTIILKSIDSTKQLLSSSATNFTNFSLPHSILPKCLTISLISRLKAVRMLMNMKLSSINSALSASSIFQMHPRCVALTPSASNERIISPVRSTVFNTTSRCGFSPW